MAWRFSQHSKYQSLVCSGKSQCAFDRSLEYFARLKNSFGVSDDEDSEDPEDEDEDASSDESEEEKKRSSLAGEDKTFPCEHLHCDIQKLFLCPEHNRKLAKDQKTLAQHLAGSRGVHLFTVGDPDFQRYLKQRNSLHQSFLRKLEAFQSQRQGKGKSSAPEQLSQTQLQLTRTKAAKRPGSGSKTKTKIAIESKSMPADGTQADIRDLLWACYYSLPDSAHDTKVTIMQLQQESQSAPQSRTSAVDSTSSSKNGNRLPKPHLEPLQDSRDPNRHNLVFLRQVIKATEAVSQLK